MLAIEIDGESHINKVKEDQIRQQRLESLGIHFLLHLSSNNSRSITSL